MPINLNKDPYFDDFVANKNFLQILFRPGRAVQARELNQLQTILKNQMSGMAAHIFNDGAKILGGEINFQGQNGNVKFLKLQDKDIHGNSGFIQELRPGMQLRRRIDSASAPEVLAKLVSVEAKSGATSDNYLFIRYLRGENPGFGSNEIIMVFNPDV